MMKHIFGLISYATLQFLYLFWEWKLMKYPYLEYMRDIDTYYDDINFY